MNTNILALREGAHLPAVREVDDQDLFVRMVERHPGHIQRRQDRKDARLRAIRRADDARDQQMRDLATVSMFSMLGAVLAVGLAL